MDSLIQSEGVARCSRYAFGPNSLRMCGPDASRELGAYLQEGVTDDGLTHMLTQFSTLHPYLQSIAAANHIRDPFDPRVVEAYWIGNELLETISERTFFSHLRDRLSLHKKTSRKSFTELTEKLPLGARMHHSFHVFNVYKRTGNMEILHTVESMDACRVSWGQVSRIEGHKVYLQRMPLHVMGHQIVLGQAVEYELQRQLLTEDVTDEARVGDWVTLHWHRPCEIVSEENIRSLEFYTRKHIKLANQTL